MSVQKGEFSELTFVAIFARAWGILQYVEFKKNGYDKNFNIIRTRVYSFQEQKI